MKNILFITVIIFFAGCSTTTTIENKSLIPEAPLLKSKAEGYFKAIGTEPFWSLEISEEKIRFQGIEAENEYLSPHKEPIGSSDTNVKLYRVKTEGGEMEVSINRQNCSDWMSDLKHDYQVDISLKRDNQKEAINYSGCGNYMADYRLFDVWLLEELQGKKVTLANFSNEIPMLEINSSAKKFSGYAGCNRISGTIFQERELLRFSSIVSTRMSCSETNMENIFLKALQSSTGYNIKNNRLHLINADGVIVVFKKFD
jgi:heat shock protein HslJ